MTEITAVLEFLSSTYCKYGCEQKSYERLLFQPSHHSRDKGRWEMQVKTNSSPTPDGSPIVIPIFIEIFPKLT